jgi:hypothetical protein
MPKITLFLLTIICLCASGCCTTRRHANANWEYKTLITSNDAVPFGKPWTPRHPDVPGESERWTSDDAVLNSMVHDGWSVAGYGIDHNNSQWFLLKRHKR